MTNENMIGEWAGISAAVDGKVLPPDTARELRLTLTQDRYKTVKGTQVLFDSTYRIDAAASPKKIFILGNEGDLTGKEAQGVYKVEGDQMTICYVMPGGPAPAGFESAPGSKAYLIVWERVK